MNMNQLILGALMAGCLSIGAPFAEDAKPAVPGGERTAKLEELKAKLEAKREAWKAGHDSLTAERKAEIEKRIAERKGGLGADRWKSGPGLQGGKEDLERRIKDRKADFESRKTEIAARRAEWIKEHARDSGAARPALTPEQQAALKARFEEWLAAHKDAAPATP